MSPVGAVIALIVAGVRGAWRFLTGTRPPPPPRPGRQEWWR